MPVTVTITVIHIQGKCMNRVALIHPSLNKRGGAEKVLLEVMDTLKKQGNQVTLYTLDRTSWGNVRNQWGIHAKPDTEVYLTDRLLNPEGLFTWGWSATAYLWLLLKAGTREQLTFNNYGEVYPYISDLSYVHSKPLPAADTGNPYRVPYWGRLKPIYNGLIKELGDTYGVSTLVTNSRYNQTLIKQSIGVDSTIVHPSVEPIGYDWRPKNGHVLTISRLNLSKNLHRIPEVLTCSRGNRFILAGAVTNQTGKLLKALGDHTRLTVILNPPREQVTSLMKESSLYLGTLETEAFGVTTLEAMSAGCVPVVPRSGGPWSDILEERQGVYGVGYGKVEEAAALIDGLLRDDKQRLRMRENGIQRSSEFSLESFESKVTGIIDEATHRELPHTWATSLIQRTEELQRQVARRRQLDLKRLTQRRVKAAPEAL